MSTTPPMYDQLRRGTVRNRALVWFADSSYWNAATRGAAFVLGINLVTYLVRQLDDMIPDTATDPPISLRVFLVDAIVATLLGALVMCLVTAAARGLLRLSVRARTGGGLT